MLSFPPVSSSSLPSVPWCLSYALPSSSSSSLLYRRLASLWRAGRGPAASEHSGAARRPPSLCSALLLLSLTAGATAPAASLHPVTLLLLIPGVLANGASPQGVSPSPSHVPSSRVSLPVACPHTSVSTPQHTLSCRRRRPLVGGGALYTSTPPWLRARAAPECKTRQME